MSRYQFICNDRGCGNCGVLLREFETRRVEDAHGNLVSKEVIPELVSDCCRGPVAIWDNVKEDTDTHSIVTNGAALDVLSDAIYRALAVHPVTDVLSALIGHFVGLTLELAISNGCDVDRQITIDGGSARDITIHAAKKPSPQAKAIKSVGGPAR